MTFRCHAAATNSLAASLETGITFLSLKKMVEGCFNNQVQRVLYSQNSSRNPATLADSREETQRRRRD